MSIFRFALAVAIVLLGPAGVRAATPDFAQECAALVPQARITVGFEDATVTRDDTRGLEQLRNMSRSSSGPYHQVYGLTQAQAGARYTMRVAMRTDADGSVCLVPSLDVTIVLTDLTVYIARELTNGCQRAIVEAHEQEHVAVWRSHLRAGARLLEPVLRAQLGQLRHFASTDAAQRELRGQVNAVLNPLLERLRDGIAQANRDVDSPQSYQAAAQRLNACP